MESRLEAKKVSPESYQAMLALEMFVRKSSKLAPSLILRQEFRRDASNHPFFLTDSLGILKRDQITATMGVVWWFGSKKSPW